MASRPSSISIGSGPVLVFLHGTGTFTGFEVARAWAAHHTVLDPLPSRFRRFRRRRCDRYRRGSCPPLYGSVRSSRLRRFSILPASRWADGSRPNSPFAQPQRLRRLVLVAPAGLVVDAAPALRGCSISPRRICRPISPMIHWRHCATFHEGAGSVLRRAAGPRGHGLCQTDPQQPARQSQARPLAASHHRSDPCAVGRERSFAPDGAGAGLDGGACPDGHLELVPETGHLVFEETPDAGRRRRRFSRRLRPAATARTRT